jgi:integrase
MAKVNYRSWKLPGQRTKRRAWGFTVTLVDGRRVKSYRSEWTKEQAEAELAKALLGVEPARPKTGGLTVAQAVERYLAAKARKRSLANDRRIVKHLKAELGADTPLAELTADRISQYRAARLSAVRKIGTGEAATERPLTAAAVNRPLALLRHLLRLAREEWGALDEVPRIRLEREPQGRIRWLEPDEEVRLLAACDKSRTKHLAAVVKVALETGLRRGELLGLTWSQVDMSRGVLRLEVTKSGRRREVPMRQAVYEALATRPEPHSGRVWPVGDVRKAFENAVVEAKLDGLHFHDLRHSFASWFVMRGGSLQALQTILGHADIKMTLRYAHLAPDHLRSEMARTERGSRLAQARAQEPVELVGASQKSL